MTDLQPTFNWDITENPVFQGTDAQNIAIVDGSKALVRNDNNETLAIVKKSYNPMTTEAFLTTMEKLVKITGFNIEGFAEFKNGQKILGFLKNDKDNLNIGGHAIKDHLLIGNAFGDTSFFLGTSTILIRCQNQFSQIEKISKIRHTKSFSVKLEELYHYVEFYYSKRDELYKTFERLGNVNTNEAMREKMIRFVLGVKETTETEISTRKLNQMDLLRANIVTEIADLGDNMFGLFNGITRYTTHDIISKEPSFGSVFGIKAEINAKALQFAEQEMKMSLVLS